MLCECQIRENRNKLIPMLNLVSILRIILHCKRASAQLTLREAKNAKI